MEKKSQQLKEYPKKQVKLACKQLNLSGSRKRFKLSPERCQKQLISKSLSVLNCFRQPLIAELLHLHWIQTIAAVMFMRKAFVAPFSGIGFRNAFQFSNVLSSPIIGANLDFVSSSNYRCYSSSRYTMRKDYYKTLGVPRSATKDEIKRSFRSLAMKYHPDVNKDNKAAEAKFKEVSEAYEVLEDEQKRRQYDAFGHEGVDLSGNGDGMDPNDPFAGFGGIDFGDMKGNGQYVNFNMNGREEQIIFEFMNMHFANDGFEEIIFHEGKGKKGKRRKNRGNDFFEDMGFSMFDFDSIRKPQKKRKPKKSSGPRKG